MFNNNASYNPYHVLLAENTAAAGDNCDGGNFTSVGFNLVEHDDGCSFLAQGTDQVGSLANPIDPRIGVLQDNGGVTPTHALLANSPAIDRGHAFMRVHRSARHDATGQRMRHLERTSSSCRSDGIARIQYASLRAPGREFTSATAKQRRSARPAHGTRRIRQDVGTRRRAAGYGRQES